MVIFCTACGMVLHLILITESAGSLIETRHKFCCKLKLTTECALIFESFPDRGNSSCRNIKDAETEFQVYRGLLVRQGSRPGCSFKYFLKSQRNSKKLSVMNPVVSQDSVCNKNSIQLQFLLGIF